MRGVAALIILVFHRRWTLPGGSAFHIENAYLAVDFFFILSGFVVALAYEKKLLGEMSFRTFALVRAIRLYPMILIGGALAAISMLATGWGGRALIASGLAGLALPAPRALVADPFFVNGPVWSLFFEIIVNLIFAATLRLVPRLLPVLFLLSGAAWMIMLYRHGMDVGIHFDTFAWGLARAGFPFGIGVLIFRYRDRLPTIPGIGFGTACLVLTAALAMPTVEWFGATAYAVVCVLAVFPALVAIGTRTTPSPRLVGFAVWLGAVSFPLYAIHYPLYRIADVAFARLGLPVSLEVPLAGTTIVILSTMAYYWFDVKVRARLSLLVRRRRAAAVPSMEPEPQS